MMRKPREIDLELQALEARAKALKERRIRQLSERWRSASLSRQALATLLSTTGVTSVLVGMRRKPYVEDALVAVGLEKLEPAATTKVYEAFAR